MTTTYAEESMLVASGQKFCTTINTLSVTGTAITLGYNTLPGNQPSTFGNKVYIWQNANLIPWNSPPLNSQNVTTDTPDGSMVFDGLNVNNNSYIIGYAVGPNICDICASSFVPAIGSTDKVLNKHLDIKIDNIGTTSLSMSFTALDGYTPKTCKNWLGLWNSSQASYTIPPDHRTKVDTDSNNGEASFNNINILRGQTYSVAYFMGENQTEMACSLTFTNASE